MNKQTSWKNTINQNSNKQESVELDSWGIYKATVHQQKLTSKDINCYHFVTFSNFIFTSFHFQLACFPPSSNLSFSFFYFRQEFFNLIAIKGIMSEMTRVCYRNEPENFQFLDKIGITFWINALSLSSNSLMYRVFSVICWACFSVRLCRRSVSDLA